MGGLKCTISCSDGQLKRQVTITITFHLMDAGSATLALRLNVRKIFERVRTVAAPV